MPAPLPVDAVPAMLAVCGTLPPSTVVLICPCFPSLHSTQPQAGTGGRSALMTDAPCLSRASSSQGAGAGRAACHISQGSMAGEGCDREMADDQQVGSLLLRVGFVGLLESE